MSRLRMRSFTSLVLASALVFAVNFSYVNATSSSSSSNYQVSEMQFGNSSALENCSGQYCATVSVGGLESSSANAGDNKVTSFGKLVPNEPSLEVVVDPGISNFGELTTETTGSKTMVVRIRNYLSSGYTLQINGVPPKYSSHTLSPMTSPAASQPGEEQFGINLTTNTAPAVGSEIVQLPSGDFSFGEVMNGYDTANLFKYSDGEVIAKSLMESGRTDYTISMIVNIANSTPAGNYSGDFSAIVVPIF